MPFEPGDEAVVVSLNRRGRIVEVRGDRHRVALGTLTIVVPASDLRAPDAGGRKGKTRRKGAATAGGRGEGDAGGPEVTRRVDLHGLTTEEAKDAVVAAVNAALLEGASVLEVMHGVGTGRVRDAARQALSRLPVVRRVRPHPTNRGITIAHL